MRHRILTAVFGVLLLVSHESRASNGLKPNAHGTKSFGRGGSDIAMPTSATSMFSNPAAIARLRDEQLEISPILLSINAEYRDPENSASSSAGPFPYANWAMAVDFEQTEAELLEELRRTDPYHKMFYDRPKKDLDTPPMEPTFGYGKIVNGQIPVSSSKFPKTVEVVARGRVAWIQNISLVANYYTTSPTRAYSSLVATSSRRTALTDASATVARFENLVNPLMDAPDEIVVYYQLEVEFRSSGDSAEVRAVVDGSDAGGATTSFSDVQPKPVPPLAEEKLPRFQHELYGAKEGLSPIKFAIGSYVQAGAGAEYKIRTELYPAGADNFTEFSFISLTPTVAVNIGDWLSLGATLQINYGKMQIKTPQTLGAEIEQGQLFPSGSLDAALGGVFGIPTEFGPAMKYALNTSDQHAPGTSITHTAKPNDPRFGEVTGQVQINEAEAFGASGKIGALITPTDRLTIGLTYQTKTAMQNYRGKAKFDFNNQIAAFIANPTQGHSDEVSILGVPTEMRFTFDQVWTQGVVDVYAFDALLLPNFPLPSGAIVDSLPNGGTRGFLAEYDIEIVDFNLPAELGIGVSYLLFDWLRVSCDYKRIFWKSAMKDFRSIASNGSNPDVNALVGSDSLPTSIPLDWKDQNVIALGVEVYVGDWLTLRGGWNFGNNPIPEGTALPIVPAITENHFSIGASVVFGSFTIDVAWMRAAENSMNINSSRQTRDLEGSTISVSQDFFSIGVQYDY